MAVTDELRVRLCRVGQRHRDLVDLIQVAHIGGVLDLHCVLGNALGQQFFPTLPAQFIEDPSQFAQVETVQADRV